MSEEREPLAPDNGGEPDDIDLTTIDPDGAPAEPDEPIEIDQPPDEPTEPTQPEQRQRQTRNPRAGEVSRWRERAETAERNLEIARQIAAQQRQQQPAPDPRAAEREEAEFMASLEMMTPQQMAVAVSQRSERRMQQQLAQVALGTRDQIDRGSYASIKAGYEPARRLESQVEATLQAFRAQGNYTLAREDILDALVGRELRTRGAAQIGRQRAAAAGRVARETTRPASARGDVASGGRQRNQASDDEALLRQITSDMV